MRKMLQNSNGAAGESVPSSRLLALLRRLGVDRGGAIFIVFALVIPVLIGSAGLGIETGMWYLEKRRVQEAVDSGALAGAFEYRSNSSITDSSLETVVTAAMTKSGYGSVAITVNRPPASGPFAVGGAQESETAVEVIATYDYPTYFIAVISINSITLAARAVAAQSGLADSTCILALGSKTYPGKTGAIEVSGSGSAYLEECSIHANGVVDPSIHLTGNASLYAECITGSNSMSSDTLSKYNSTTPDPFTPGVDIGIYTSDDCGEPSGTAGTVEDPFADLIAPDKTGEACSNTFPIGSGGGGAINYAATPGNYCGLSEIRPNDSLNFAPGVYYIQDGLTLKGTITGTGVIIIMQGADADINFTSQSTVDLSAATLQNIIDSPLLYADLDDVDGNGPSSWGGILIYNETAGTDDCSTFDGGNTTLLGGVIYMPNSCIEFTGGSAAEAKDNCLQIVGDQITITGGASLSTSGCGVYGSDFLSASAVGLVE